MIPVLIVPVLNRYDLLDRMLDSIDHPVGHVVIVDNGGGLEHDGLHSVIRLPHNIGVGAAWNLGMKVTPLAPWWLIANNDLEWGQGDLARLTDAVDPEADDLYFMLGMAAFAVTRYTIGRLGYFDENIHPAYDEDVDYSRRADLVGVRKVEVGFTGSHVGSATIYSDAELRRRNAHTHWANDLYYAAKWGGQKQGGETFATPFNREGHVGEWQLDPERLRTQAWKRDG